MYERKSLFAPIVAMVAAFSLAGTMAYAQSLDRWVGSYDSPFGVSLTLEAGSAGSLTGELAISADDSASRFPVSLRADGSSGLEGQFSSGGDSFPLRVEPGEEPNQIVMISDGNVYELERRGGSGGNPLAQAGTESAAGTNSAVGHVNYQHPNGFYNLSMPEDWDSILHAAEILELDSGVEDEMVLVLSLELDANEIGRPLLQNLPGALAAVTNFLGSAGIDADPSNAETSTTSVGPLTGAISTFSGSESGRPFSLWQGTVIDGPGGIVVLAAAREGQQANLVAAAESIFKSLSLGGSSGNAGATSAVSAGGRNVLFNGERLDGETLVFLEGPVPMIPDGNYWYDKRSGMVGGIGGPTMAYFAAGLDFCPPISPQASGGFTNVSLNGRYVHPDDLTGLEFYFGPVQPNRYWMDDDGNYGIENGPILGNLIEQIALMEMLAAASLQQGAVAGGQGGFGGAGGGGGAGGSVYSHFPNLGAGGTGVGVADLGGGDTIVNAGGVMWWPGK